MGIPCYGALMEAGTKKPGYRRLAIVLPLLLGLGVVAGASSLFTFVMIESTSTVEFCAVCHEMDVFVDTWEAAAHGPDETGAIAAVCVDCHLPDPEAGHIAYLYEKGRSGTNDVVKHLLGDFPDWIANLEEREHFTFESGCRKCHVELVAPGIPLKAITAHRDYLTGQTEETCIGCHADIGHAALKAAIQDRLDAGTLEGKTSGIQEDLS
jgi:nitrate/TMAO reductase-like tetraheme cytochrome c subunit